MGGVPRGGGLRPGLTARGWSLLVAGAALLLAGVLLAQRDLSRAGLLLVILVLASLVGLLPQRPRLTVRRTLLVERAEVGAPAPTRLEIRNDGRRTGDLVVQDTVDASAGAMPRFVLAGLRPGRREFVTEPLLPSRRGRLDVGPLRVGVVDPLGLATVSRRIGPVTQLTAYPRVLPLATGMVAAGTGDEAETLSGTRTGQSLSVREYRQGDDLRRVHWRSTARAGELMVRGEEATSTPQAGILLDNRAAALPTRAGQAPDPFEWAVSMAASVCADLGARGYRVTLTTQDAAGRPVLDETGHLEVLAHLRPVAGDTGLDPGDGGGAGTTIAILGRLGPADLARLAGPGEGRLAFLLDRDDAAAAAALRRAGWDVVPVDPGTSPARLWPQEVP